MSFAFIVAPLIVLNRKKINSASTPKRVVDENYNNESKKKAHTKSKKSDQPYQRPLYGLSTFNTTVYGSTDDKNDHKLESKELTVTQANKLKKQILNAIQSLSNAMKVSCLKATGDVSFTDLFKLTSGENLIKLTVDETHQKFLELKILFSQINFLTHDQIKEIKEKIEKMFNPDIFRQRVREKICKDKLEQSVQKQVHEIADGIHEFLISISQRFEKFASVIKSNIF